jgi:hypothetical protein
MPEISRSTVSLRIFGININPDLLTQSLGCSPSLAAKRGESFSFKPDGKKRIAKEGFWRLEYEENDALNLEEKIEFLLGHLTNDLNAWQVATQDARGADLFCGLFIDHWNEGFELSPKLLRKIGERNLQLSFDVYSPTNTWRSNTDE